MQKPCLEPGCPNLVERGRCDWHRRQFERPRKVSGATGARGSTRSWRKLRLEIAAEQAERCASCDTALLEGWQLHHRNGDATDDRRENLEALCAECHKDEHRPAEVRR
jgi:5-methylcytosine-specific restriction endonuclease McrA